LRRLIVNADDLGLTPGVNRAIAEAHRNGIVTSSTLMATGPAFGDAVTVARSVPRLTVGCHVLLVDGRPALPQQTVPDLVDRASDGQFHQALGSFAGRAAIGQIHAEQIEAEATAQIRKLQEAGITVSHVDTHKHTHILPQVLRPLLRAAAACGVRAVRNPFGPLRISLLWGHLELWRQYGRVSLLSWLAGRFRAEVRRAGMLTCNGTIGIVTTGFLDQALLNRMIDSLPDGTWELVCHPGYNDAGLDKVKTRLRESRAAELKILTSEETRKLLVRNGIELVTYRDLG
jgi:hopanoid biosynthesis associated protein HpnK